MSPRLVSSLRRAVPALAVVLALGLAVGSATAGEVEALQPNAHQLAGSLPDGAEHYVPLELPAGTVLSFQFRADKRQRTLTPEGELVGPDGLTIPIPVGNLNFKKGYDVKKLVVGATGRHVLVLRGANGTTGSYTLKVKAKYPTKFSGVIDGSTDPLEFEFAATTGAKVSATVSGPKGGAVPELPRVRQPNGNSFGPSKLKNKKTGFAFKGFEQSSGFGSYALTFGVRSDTAQGDRTFKYKVSVSFPKVKKLKLSYSDLIIAPLVVGATPDDLPVSADVVDFRVTGRFFQPGATLILRFPGQTEWIPEGQTVTDTGISVPLTTFGRAPGRWDVAAINPSGGEAVVSGALLIRPPTPTVTSAEPPFVADDLTETSVTLRGTNLSVSTEVSFSRDLLGGGTETFVPTRIQTAPVGSGIQVTFSPFRRPIGLYDITVQNPGPTIGVPGSVSTTGPDIVEIRNAPPRLVASTPDRNLPGGSFRLTATGTEMEPGAQLYLERDGENAVAGTAVTVTTNGLATSATFDMDGRAVGVWDLRIRNSDGQEDQLGGVFAVFADSAHTFGDSLIGEPSMAIASELDLGLLAWIETDETGTGGTRWKVMTRRFDSFLNTWSGAALEISNPLTQATPTRFASVAYNPDVDEWLVVWTEHTFAATVNERVRAGLNPTSGTVYQVYGRRVAASGATAGAEIDFIDGSASATGGGQVYDQFEYFNPQVVYGPWDGNWYLTFTQQWDALTGDDFDVFVWRLAKADPKLDSAFHVAVHTTQNHEGDCLAAVDDDGDRLFLAGSCDSRQQTTAAPREIEAKFVSSTGGLSPGSGGSNVGEVIPVTTRVSGEVEHFTNPRPAYNGGAGEFVVVYERINETGSGNKEIRAQRVSAAGSTAVGSEIVVATDSSNDLILPRIIYNAVQDEYLVTWTVDDPGGSPLARAQRLDGSAATTVGAAFDLGSTGSGLPIVIADPVRGNYVKFIPTGFTALGAERTATSGAALEIFE